MLNFQFEIAIVKFLLIGRVGIKTQGGWGNFPQKNNREGPIVQDSRIPVPFCFMLAYDRINKKNYKQPNESETMAWL